MRLRQIALVARDLESSAAQLGQLLGISSGSGYHDPGIIKFGLDNWVAPLGDTFVEIVSPVQDDTTAGRYLDRRGGDGGYMVILQVPDLARARQSIEAAGARIVWQAKGVADDGSDEVTEGLHVHPRDCGGAILSVDEATPPEAWVWAGPQWRESRSSFVSQILAVELQGSEPEAMAQQWSRLLAQEYRSGRSPDGRPAWILGLEDPDDLSGDRQPGSIRFVADEDGRGDGVRAFDVEIEDADAARTALSAANVSPEEHGNCSSVDAVGVTVFYHGL